MNVSTFIVLVIVILLVVLSARYLLRTGPCGECSSKDNCPGSCSKMPKDKKTKEKIARIDALIDKHKACDRRKA